jgi:hypothetical protein
MHERNHGSLYAMKLISCINALRLAVLIGVLGGSQAFAQLYTFTGTITSSQTALASVGDSVVVQYHLDIPLSTVFADPSLGIYYYNCDWTSMSVGGVELFRRRDILVGKYGLSGHYGIGQAHEGSFGVLSGYVIGLESSQKTITSPSGLILPDLPISAFAIHFGRILDQGYDPLNYPAHSAEFDITAYRVSGLPSAVPEPSTYAIYGSIALAALVIYRRFRR